MKLVTVLLITVVVVACVSAVSVNSNRSVQNVPEEWGEFLPLYPPRELMNSVTNLLDNVMNSLPKEMVVAVKHIIQDLNTIKSHLPTAVIRYIQNIIENMKTMLPQLMNTFEIQVKSNKQSVQMWSTLLQQVRLVLEQTLPFVDNLNLRISTM